MSNHENFHVMLSVMIFLLVFNDVFGCGQFPQGQVPFMRFTVMGTRLPVEMAYSGMLTVQASFPLINRDEQMAKNTLQRQIMTAVEDVLEQEGRNAFLPHPIITEILQQLNISLNFTPINCVLASSNPVMQLANFMVDMPEGCFIVGGFVTHVCATTANAMCRPPPMMEIVPVPSKYMTFTGEFRTSNIIMANWSRQMKESVLSRVRRRLSSSSTSFGMFFDGATITLNN